MEKTSIGPANLFCPQALFAYGTYKEDGSPNFGTFTWFSYCWDSEMGVMASIGGHKLTIERIRANKMFSANLVTEALLPLADYLGCNAGYKTPDKMDIPLEIERGAVLPVPVLAQSPWVFELEVQTEIPLNGNSVFLCKIRNVLAEKTLLDESFSPDERLKRIAPVVWIGAGPYFSINPVSLGSAGDWKDQYAKMHKGDLL